MRFHFSSISSFLLTNFLLIPFNLSPASGASPSLESKRMMTFEKNRYGIFKQQIANGIREELHKPSPIQACTSLLPSPTVENKKPCHIISWNYSKRGHEIVKEDFGQDFDGELNPRRLVEMVFLAQQDSGKINLHRRRLHTDPSCLLQNTP